MTEQKHRIWSDLDLDYEDWRADLEADYPELTEDERMMLMYEMNNGYLDDERPNCFTTQFHPEANAGPKDTEYLFNRFIDSMGGAR